MQTCQSERDVVVGLAANRWFNRQYITAVTFQTDQMSVFVNAKYQGSSITI